MVDGAGSIVFRLMYNAFRAAYEPALAALAAAMTAEVKRPDAYRASGRCDLLRRFRRSEESRRSDVLELANATMMAALDRRGIRPMSTHTVITTYLRGQIQPGIDAVGGFFRTCVLTGKALFRRPFQWRETIEQGWFITSVSLLPTLAVAIPLTVLIIFTLNILLAEFGAADISGAGAALGAVTQLGPLTTVLVIAGAGSTAICADLGARTIREEIDAMEVLGIDPIHRLVVPRVVAATIVATLLNGAVITIGLVGGFLFGVFIQHISAGAYVSTLTLVTGLPEVIISVVKSATFGTIAGLVGCYRGLTTKGGPKGVGIAVNETLGVVRDRAVRGQRGADHDRRAVRDGALRWQSAAAVLRARYPRTAANLNRYGGGTARRL